MSEFRRRLMMVGNGGDVYTYQNAQYILNQDTAYIDTGVIPNQDTRIVLDFTYRGYNSGAGSSIFEVIFGAGNRTDSDAFILFRNYTSGSAQPQYRNSYRNQGHFYGNSRYNIDFNKNVYSGDGTYNFTYNTFTCPNTLSIGFMPYRTSFRYTYLEIYSCSIYDNGTLVRDYTPKLRSDGKYGLWDSVGQTFYLSPNGALFTGAI